MGLSLFIQLHTSTHCIGTAILSQFTIKYITFTSPVIADMPLQTQKGLTCHTVTDWRCDVRVHLNEHSIFIRC